MDGKQFNLPREIKCSDLVAECTSRLNELHRIMQSISFETSIENIVKIQRLKFESAGLQSSIQILFEQMSLKCTSSNGTTTTTETASQTDEFDGHSQLTTIDRADKPLNTEPFSNIEKNEKGILHWTHGQANLMRIPHSRPYMPKQIIEMEHSRGEKRHSHLNKLSRITVSYEMEIQKLDRKLQNSMEKYTKVKCCAVILLDIIDHLKRKLRLTNNNRKVREVADKVAASDGTSHDKEYVVVEPLNRPINKISVKSVGSNSISLSEEQIELPDKELIQNHNDNDNKSKSEVLVECASSCRRQHGFLSNEFNLKKDKSTQTDRKFNHDESIVDEQVEEEEQDFCRNFNYHLNGSELLAVTKKSKSKQSRMVRPQKMDCKCNLLVGRRKCVRNDVKVMKKSNVAYDRKKYVGNNALDVLKPEINKTMTVTFKKWPNRKTNTNRTIRIQVGPNSTKQTNQQKNILRSSGTRKTVSNKVADAAAYKMTRGADEKETIDETETKTILTLKLKPKPKPKLKTLVKHQINKHDGNTTKSCFREMKTIE